MNLSHALKTIFWYLSGLLRKFQMISPGCWESDPWSLYQGLGVYTYSIWFCYKLHRWLNSRNFPLKHIVLQSVSCQSVNQPASQSVSQLSVSQPASQPVSQSVSQQSVSQSVSQSVNQLAVSRSVSDLLWQRTSARNVTSKIFLSD